MRVGGHDAFDDVEHTAHEAGEGEAPAGIETEEFEDLTDGTDKVNRWFGEDLQRVYDKEALDRFAEPVRNDRERRSTAPLTEEEFAEFVASLDRVMYPRILGPHGDARRVWKRYRKSRGGSTMRVLRRFIGEAREAGRRFDTELDRAELKALERLLHFALLRRHVARLRNFVGQAGVDAVDLAFALWTYDAAAWRELATGKERVTLAVRAVIEPHGHGHGDTVERSRPPQFVAASGGAVHGALHHHLAPKRPHLGGVRVMTMRTMRVIDAMASNARAAFLVTPDEE